MIRLYLLIIINLLIAFYILGDGFKKEIKEFLNKRVKRGRKIMRDLNKMKDEALYLLNKGIAIYIKLEEGKNISVFPPTSNSNIYKSSLEIWDGHDWELIMNFTPKEDPKELIDALFIVFEKEIRRIRY